METAVPFHLSLVHSCMTSSEVSPTKLELSTQYVAFWSKDSVAQLVLFMVPVPFSYTNCACVTWRGERRG